MNPVILHIPHASTRIPDEDLDLYVISQEALARENLLLADLHTDELYQMDDAHRAVFPVSRFVVDPERFSDDAREPMAAKGMGATYTVTTDLSPLRPGLTPARRDDLMNRYYWPHHTALDRAAQDRLAMFGECLVVDCHSYPSKTLPYEAGHFHRPEIGIGTDPFHTPSTTVRAMVDAFQRLGYEVGLDTPFSGSLVPNAFYGRDKRVSSIMIEVRRDLYMDEETGRKTANFPKISADLTLAMHEAAKATLGRGLTGHPSSGITPK